MVTYSSKDFAVRCLLIGYAIRTRPQSSRTSILPPALLIASSRVSKEALITSSVAPDAQSITFHSI